MDACLWNKSNFFGFIFMQESLIILQIKASFTIFMVLRPVIIMWSPVQWPVGMKNTLSGRAKKKLGSILTRVPLHVSNIKVYLSHSCNK